jgi:hypothetical protein
MSALTADLSFVQTTKTDSVCRGHFHEQRPAVLRVLPFLIVFVEISDQIVDRDSP